MVFGHFRLFARHRKSPSFKIVSVINFLASVHLSGSGDTHKKWESSIAILQFKMLSEVDLWLQCIITVPEIPILGGIWSFAAVFQKPEVWIS